ncbi:MAG: efflux RND transporter permease subunit [Myxococcota bacterium]
MKAIDSLLARPLPIHLAALLLGLFGLWSAYTLPLKRNPSVEVPVVVVTAEYVGAAPEDVEAEVTLELEEELNTIDSLRHLRSISAEGIAWLVLEFEDRADMTASVQAVRDKVDLAEPDLPDGVENLTVREISFDDLPILFFTIVGSPDPYLLRDIAEELEPKLESVPGVSRIDIFGGYQREVRILVDPPLLTHYGLTFDQVAAALRRQAAPAPAGRLRSSAREFLLRPTGEFQSLEEIRHTVIARRAGNPVRLADLARVELDHERMQSGAFFDGEPCVTLIARRRVDVNTLETARRLLARVDAVRASLPPGVEIHTTSNSVRIIEAMVQQLSLSALMGLGLVVGVLWLVFGWRQALLVSSVLPFSLLAVFAGLKIFGMAISNIALFSIVLVLGLVVDGAIIVGEAIYREREAGRSRRAAAQHGLERVGIPVLSAHLTTIAAFVPMLLMVGVMGQFMAVLPKVVIFALTGALFVDHLLLPAIAGRIELRRRTSPRLRAPDGLPWFSPELPRARRLYLGHLDYALRHAKGVVGLAGLAVGLAVLLLSTGVIRSIFLPTADRGRVWVNYELPPGTPIEETGRVGRLISHEIAELPEVESIVLTTGDTGALKSDQRESGRVGPRFGKVTVELVDAEQRKRSQEVIAALLRKRLAHLAGVTLDVEQLSEGPPVGAALTLRLHGRDLEDLEHAARIVEARVRELPLARDVRVDYARTNPETRVILDRTLAATLHGITQDQVSRTLLSAFEGDKLGRMWIGNQRVDIRLIASPSFAHTTENVRELGLRSRSGELVPLGELAEVRYALSHGAIFRQDTRRTVTVFADAAPGSSSLELEKAALQAVTELSMPPGVELGLGGEREERDRSYASLWRALKWGLLLIFVVMAIQFNSLVQPLIVLAAVPLSLIGIVLGLLVTGLPFSFMVFIGAVALTGIVVNDGIVMVDAINRNRADGMPLQNAIRDAALSRLRPVLLTTITTAFGLLPLTLNVAGGGEFWVPLGVAIISGLVVASALTLHFVPVLYALIERPRLGGQRRPMPIGVPQLD